MRCHVFRKNLRLDREQGLAVPGTIDRRRSCRSASLETECRAMTVVNSRRLPGFHAPQWAAISIIAAVLGVGADLLLPLQLGAAVTAGAYSADVTGPVIALAGLVALAVGAAVVGTFASEAYLVASTMRIRSDLGQDMLTQRTEFAPADLVTRLLVDARQAAAILPIVTSVAVSSISLLFGLILLGLIDWTLLIGVLLGLVLVLAMLRRFVDDSRPLVHRYRGGTGRDRTATDRCAAGCSHDSGKQHLANRSAPSAHATSNTAGLWRRSMGGPKPVRLAQRSLGSGDPTCHHRRWRMVAG